MTEQRMCTYTGRLVFPRMRTNVVLRRRRPPSDPDQLHAADHDRLQSKHLRTECECAVSRRDDVLCFGRSEVAKDEVLTDDHEC